MKKGQVVPAVTTTMAFTARERARKWHIKKICMNMDKSATSTSPDTANVIIS